MPASVGEILIVFVVVLSIPTIGTFKLYEEIDLRAVFVPWRVIDFVGEVKL